MRACWLLLALSGCDLLGDGEDSALFDAGETGVLVGITAAHNRIRAEKGVGDLAWDGALAQVAQDWADTLAADDCAFMHSTTGYGENLYAFSAAGQVTPDTVVDAWASEEAWYDYATNTCTPPEGGSCGHYTQVVWAGSERVGCGVSVCDTGWELWVCNYDPPGNWVGEKPY